MQGQGHGFTNAEDIFGAFGDVFEDLFGFSGGRGRRSQTRARRGADLRHDLTLSFEEACFGCEKKIEVTRRETCPECAGSRARKGTKPEVCPQCRGQGQVGHSQGFFVVSTTCPMCRGEGSLVRHPCAECRGVGLVQHRKSLSVKIPAGVEDGMRVVLSGQGEPGEHNGPAGDLFIFLQVNAHSFFERRGEHIYCKVTIPMTQAALGGALTVPTLAGEEVLSIPPGTQTGDTLDLPDKGVPHLKRGRKGDQYVTIIVETPRTLSEKERQLIEELARLRGENAAIQFDTQTQDRGKKKKKRGLFG